VTDKIHLHVDASLRELVPSFIAARRKDLEALRRAVHSGDLGTIRRVGHNIRAFSRLYGFDDLTTLGEQLERAADEASTLRIVHLQGQLADYLERVEVGD
jgi:HPt (histidine-containing phosphotransfer) domain-containing protein